MGRLGILLLGLFLFAVVAQPAMSNAPGEPLVGPTQDSRQGIQEKSIELAQRGRCRSFGEMYKCTARYDRRTKACVCPGVPS